MVLQERRLVPGPDDKPDNYKPFEWFRTHYGKFGVEHLDTVWYEVRLHPHYLHTLHEFGMTLNIDCFLCSQAKLLSNRKEGEEDDDDDGDEEEEDR